MNIDYLKDFEKKLINEKFGNKEFILEKGESNFIVSAPHSVKQIRNNKEKEGEYRTGLIAKLMNHKFNHSIIYKTKNLNDDANYDSNCNFKNELVGFIKKNEISFLFDLHISSPKRVHDIELGTAHGVNLNFDNSLLLLIKSHFEKHYKTVLVDKVFVASYPYTVSKFINSKTQIPTIQIEINWNCINTIEKAMDFSDKLNELINLISKEIK